MRIAQIARLLESVPPQLYGGAERVVRGPARAIPGPQLPRSGPALIAGVRGE